MKQKDAISLLEAISPNPLYLSEGRMKGTGKEDKVKILKLLVLAS